MGLNLEVVCVLVWCVSASVTAAPKIKIGHVPSQVPMPSPETPVSPAKEEDLESNVDDGEDFLSGIERQNIPGAASADHGVSWNSKVISRKKRNAGGDGGSRMLTKIRAKRSVGLPPDEVGMTYQMEGDNDEDALESKLQMIPELSDEELDELLYLLGKLQRPREDPTVDYIDDNNSENPYYELIPEDYTDDDTDLSWADQPVAIPYLIPAEQDSDYPDYSDEDSRRMEDWLSDFLAQEAVREAEEEDPVLETDEDYSPILLKKRSQVSPLEYYIPDYDEDQSLTTEDDTVEDPEIGDGGEELEGFLLIPIEDREGEESADMGFDGLDARSMDVDSLELNERIAQLAEDLNEQQDVGLLKR